MPTYPTPGSGLSTAGLDKTEGWDTPVRPGSSGIDHAAGLWKGGLDTQNNPLLTSVTETAITATGATISWTTQIAQPAGTLYYQVQEGAWQSAPDAGTPPTVSHSAVLTGLTPNSFYTYRIVQPSTAGGKVEYMGEFRTPSVIGGLGAQQRPSTAVTYTQQEPSRTLRDTAAASRRVDDAEPKGAPFSISGLTVEDVTETEALVTWRTGVYTDGTVVVRLPGEEGEALDEPGAKRMNHAVPLSGLTPDTTYEVEVTSADAQGNTAHAGPFLFITEAPSTAV